MAAPSEHEWIARIYEAAVDGELWPATLTEIAQAVGAHHIFLGTHDRIHGAQSIAPLTDPGHLDDYNAHWVDKNPCVTGMIAAPIGRIFHTPGELGDGEAYRRSEIFNEWCRSGDMGYGAMCVALNRSQRRHAFTSVYKRWGVDAFEAVERERYAAAVYHISRALELQARVLDLRSELDAAAGAMTSLDDGIVVTDAAARVLYLGGAAIEILDRLGLTLEQGAPLLLPEVSTALQQLVRSCADPVNGRQGGVLTVPRPGRFDLRVTVLPVPANQRSRLGLDPDQRPAAIIVLTDAELRMERVSARLATVYGLTPAELRLAAEIARGDGKHRAAQRCGISYATARAQLSSIFEKTGVHRQAELVRLIIGG